MGKQVISIIIVIAIIGGVWYWSQTDQGAQQNAAVNPSASSSTATGDVHSADGLTANTDGGPAATDKSEADIEQLNPEEFPDVSADEVYKNADEALEAISRASVDYDDLVLQQFVALKDCAWCEPFYSSVKDLVLQTTDIDQNSFYAEVLAISAKRENIEFLVDQVKSDPKSERSEAIAEALEFAVTDDDTVQYLSNFLEDPSELLVESVAAAISNQGTVLAARILYDNAIKTDNPDGFYSVGVGLGEMIPEPEAFVFLQEQVLKQNNYSHLAVKALLNSGMPGLELVFQSLNKVGDVDATRAALTDALDHVAFGDEEEAYLVRMAQAAENPALREFATEVLKDFELEALDEEEESELVG